MNGIKTSLKVGLQMLQQMARAGNEPVTVRELAETLNQSDKYLEQLLLPLRRAQLVQSVRGAHGGYRLARDPGAIRLDQITQVLQGPVTFCNCRNGRCRECVVPDVWQSLEQCVLDTLSHVSLADIAQAPAFRVRRPRVRPLVGGSWVQDGLGI
jgi:Rrf2 family cysteine metabolism transcriptional repressor